MPNYTGINHLAMATGDLPATIRFWRDLLGMRLVVGLGREGWRHYFFEIGPHDMIAFFEWPGVQPGPEKDHGAPAKGPFTFDHVAVGVAGDDDLFELEARLEAADVWVSEPVDHGFIHSIYAFDPNNIAIEFSAPVPGTDPRRAPAMVDAQPLPEALEGAAPQPGVWPPPGRIASGAERAVYEGEGARVRDAIRAGGNLPEHADRDEHG